jgi:heptosyltransferase-2/heptosyltransferase-3
MAQDYKNILVIRMRAFGDTLLTTPLLRNLKKRWPRARLTVLVEPAMRMILDPLPYVDAVLPFDRAASKRGGKFSELAANIRFWRFLRRQQFDLVLDVLGTPRTAAMALATGAPQRLGFAFRVRKWAYTRRHQPSRTVRYMADYNSDLLRLLGHEPDNLELDFPVSAGARRRAAVFLEKAGLKGKTILAVAPAGGWWLKRLKPETFARASDIFCAKAKARPLILWGPGEEELAAQTARAMHQKSRKPVLAPPSDFDLMGALMRKSRMLLANDGATKHLAVAVGTPSVTAFGPTNPDAWHPPHDSSHAWVADTTLACRPCDAFKVCPIQTHSCLADLPAERLAGAALAIFVRLKAARRRRR